MNFLWRTIHLPFSVLEQVVQVGLILPLPLGLANQHILSFKP